MYHSGQTFSQHFANFAVTVKVLRERRRIYLSVKEKNEGHACASLSLPLAKAQQLAHALLTASAGDVEPIVFEVDESAMMKPVAA